MEDYTTVAIEKLANGVALGEIIRQEVERIINEFIAQEFLAFMGYERYARDGDENDCRNGSYTRKYMTLYGEIAVKMPRNRNGGFTQHTIPPYARHSDDLETTVITLFCHGMTMSEISEIIEKMYGKYYSAETVSNMTMAIEQDVMEFHGRPLEKRYAVIYADATYVRVKRGKVASEPLHVLVGITPEGKIEVIDFCLYPTESAENYEEMLMNARERGAEEVLMVVTDGLSGIEDAVSHVYPKARHQTCWTHVQRNVVKKVRVSDRKAVAADLRDVHEAPDRKTGEERLKAFCEKYEGTYPRMVAPLKARDDLFSFMDMPVEIRKSVYTTNPIENLHKHIAKCIDPREQFPNEKSLGRAVYGYVGEFNAKYAGKVYRGFGQCCDRLDAMFYEVYGDTETDDPGDAQTDTAYLPDDVSPQQTTAA